MTTAATAEDAAIANAKANDAAAAGLIAPAFLTGPNAEVPAWEQALQKEYATAQNEANAGNQNISGNISALNPMEAALKNFEKTSGVSMTDPLSAYLSEQPTAMPTLGQVATPQDYATEAALQQLLGSRFSSAPINAGTASEAGTFTPPTTPAANPAALAQEIADAATQGTFAQKEVPNLTGLEGILGNSVFQGDFGTIEAMQAQQDLAANTPTAESQVLGNPQTYGVPNFYSPYNASAYEGLLQYLQGLNPSGISGSAGNFTVNS
jgi:hypothetical protein